MSDRKDKSIDALVEARSAQLAKMSMPERIERWWLWDGRFLVGALKRSKEHSPTYLEALAVASGDLVFEADGFARVSDEFLEALESFSRHSSAGFQLAKRICIFNLALGRLQSNLQPLAALIMAGEWKQPRPGKGHTSKNWQRDLLLVRGIASSAKFGISATRNEASDNISGCDLVIEAFEEAGRRDTPTYDAVKKVWQRRRELIADHEEVEFLVYRQSVDP